MTSSTCGALRKLSVRTRVAFAQVKVMGVVLLDDSAQIGNMPDLYDDVHMGSKGSTGDLRFEPSQNAARSSRP